MGKSLYGNAVNPPKFFKSFNTLEPEVYGDDLTIKGDDAYIEVES
jgi:hypothetical protein